MNKSGIKRIALAMIVQAIKDLHLTDEKIRKITRINELDRISAHRFFESDLGKLCAEILDIKVIKEIYNFYRTKNLIKGDLRRNRKNYKRKYKTGVII